MGSYNTTLVLFKEKQDPKTFLSDFHKKIKDMNVVLEKSDYHRIVFNDKRMKKSMSLLN